MKRILGLILIFLLNIHFMNAQDMSVAYFYLDENDLTANRQETIVLDQNGEKCALIKIITTQTGFTFDVGSLGVQRTLQMNGVIWVYVPQGVRKISIFHQQIGSLVDYAFPVNIEKARTYVMKLTTGSVQTVVKQAVTQQYVLFKLNPTNAVVELNGQMLETSDGTATKRMPFGTYDYKVQAPKYETTTGSITVNDPVNKHILNVSLVPAFANITFKAETECEIWIDGEYKGRDSTSLKLGYGSYLVECKKQNYRSTSQEITISKGDEGRTIILSPPSPIYGSLDINSTPADADVYIDGKKVGTTPMFINEFLMGNHIIELCKSGFNNYLGEVVVDVNKTTTFNCTLEKRIVHDSKQVNKDDFSYNNVESILDAAKKGNDEAQCAIGGYYFSGFKVSQNYQEAVKWFTEAAYQGNAKAQYFLGVCYEKGYSVQKSITEAKKWYTWASQKDEKDAKRALQRLNSK